MIISDISTDTFYKFLTIISIVSIIYGCKFMSDGFVDNRDSYIEFQLDSLQIALQIDKLILKKELLETYHDTNRKNLLNIDTTGTMFHKIATLEKEINYNKNKVAVKRIRIEDGDLYLGFITVISTLLVTFGFIGLGFGFSRWYYRQQKTKDKELLRDYIKLGRIANYCNSCGCLMTKDTERPKERNGEMNLMYCCDCYADGEFTKPDLTFNQMKQRILDSRKIKLGLYWRIHCLKYQNRWKNRASTDM